MLPSNSTATSLGDSQFGLEMINTLPATAGLSNFPSSDNFQDQLIQRQIRDRLPHTAILVLQVLQTLGLVSTMAAIFLAPAIVTLLRYAERATSLTNGLAMRQGHLDFAQHADNLFRGVAFTARYCPHFRDGKMQPNSLNKPWTTFRRSLHRVAATIEQDGNSTRVTLADDGEGIADPADPADLRREQLESQHRRGGRSRRVRPSRPLAPGLHPALARPLPGPKPRLPLGAGACSLSSAAMRPMSSRTTAPPGRMALRSPSKRPRRLTPSALSLRPPRGITPCQLPSTARLSNAAPSWTARSMWNHGRASCSASSRTSHAGYRIPDVNFHGLTLPVRLPQIDTVEGGTWSARADIDSCPDLELVLPARKEAVETPFLEEMREAARLAVYRAMAQADPAPRVAWTDWHKAKEAGIEMPEPPAELRPWRPAIADTDYWDERSAFTAVGSDALVMQADPEPPEAQALHRALGLTGLQDESTARAPAVRPRAEVRGLSLVRRARARHRHRDPRHRGWRRSFIGLASLDRENGGEPERPETIVMHLNVLHPPKSPHHCFRKCDTIAVPADLAFAGEAWSSLHDALPLVTADSGIAPEELSRLLRAAFFSPSDDAEADSWETQLTRFEETALHMSLKLMCSVEEARQRTIADAVWREIFWLMPRDRTVTIVVHGGKVSVDIGPACTEAATDAGNVEVVQ